MNKRRKPLNRTVNDRECYCFSPETENTLVQSVIVATYAHLWFRTDLRVANVLMMMIRAGLKHLGALGQTNCGAPRIK